MAILITCPACKNEVSNIAEKCPHCGHPIKEQEVSGFLSGLGAIFLFIGFLWWPGFIIAFLIFIWAAFSKS